MKKEKACCMNCGNGLYMATLDCVYCNIKDENNFKKNCCEKYIGEYEIKKGRKMIVNKFKTGAERIAAERQRQIEEEGFTAEYDNQWDKEQMAVAAACYALPDRIRDEYDDLKITWFAFNWPWADEFWKPSPGNRIRELEKAGALIAAEIDRLLRLEDKQ